MLLSFSNSPKLCTPMYSTIEFINGALYLPTPPSGARKRSGSPASQSSGALPFRKSSTSCSVTAAFGSIIASLYLDRMSGGRAISESRSTFRFGVNGSGSFIVRGKLDKMTLRIWMHV
eukprot:gene16160-biopygen16279